MSVGGYERDTKRQEGHTYIPPGFSCVGFWLVGVATWSDTCIPPPRVSHLYPPSEIPKSCAESQAAWGSLAKYPGALAAPTRSPVSAPSTVPEPVGAGACSRRHVPCHLENEQVEREQKPLHLRAVAGGVVFSGLSGSVPSEREGERFRRTCVQH